MNRLTIGLTVALLAGGLASVGCNCEKVKQQLAEVQQQYNDLSAAHQQTQKDLVNADSKARQLQGILDGRSAELAAAQAELADLKSKVSVAPEPPQGWEKTKTGAKLTIASDVLFSAGRASLSKKGLAKLREAAGALKGKYSQATVRVYGYCDSDPIKKSAARWKDNLDLSANRAMAVTRELRKLGVESDRIETIGMGATNPIASNKTKAGKAKNRRVEIVVTL